MPQLRPKHFERSLPFFVNQGTLLEDLSFSYYFHSDMMNQILHFGSLLLLFASLAMFLASKSILSAICIFLCYASFLSYLDFYSGICYGVWFSICILFGCFMDDYIMTYICSLFWLFLPPFQLFGHIFYERKLPAFRPFEALFTTPLLMMLMATNYFFGWNEGILLEIRTNSAKWISYKQRRF